MRIRTHSGILTREAWTETGKPVSIELSFDGCPYQICFENETNGTTDTFRCFLRNHGDEDEIFTGEASLQTFSFTRVQTIDVVAADELRKRSKANLSFNDLRRANRDRNSLWDKKGKIGILFAAVEMFGELGELANQIKKVEREKMGLVGSPPDWDKIEKELGDAVITLDLIAMRLRVNLDTAVRKKFNADSEKHNFSIKL